MSDYFEKQRREGKCWKYEAVIPLTAGQSTLLGFNPGDDAVCFAGWELATKCDKLTIEIFEGDSWTGGTPGTFVNLNRNIARVEPGDGLKLGVTANPVGTRVMLRTILSKAEGAMHDFENVVDRLCLKFNTDYIMKITNNGAQAADTQVSFMIAEREVI